MYPKQIKNLIEDFTKLPSIGPRQATRMAFSLLKKPESFIKKFTDDLNAIKNEIAFCSECFLTHEKRENEISCVFCLNPKRDKNLICVIQKELEVSNIEKSGVFNGVYHVLGEDVDIMDKEDMPLRIKSLLEKISSKSMDGKEKVELILATNPTTEGDVLLMYLKQKLEPLNVKISTLGRGLSSGGELEYADQNTITHAFKNRL